MVVFSFFIFFIVSLISCIGSNIWWFVGFYLGKVFFVNFLVVFGRRLWLCFNLVFRL